MRVGFNGRGLRDPLLRGFNRYTFCLLEQLQRRSDVELHIYTDDRSPVHPFFRDRLRARIVEARVPKVLMWEQAVLPWQLRRDRIDIFHAPCEGGLPAIRTCPYVMTYHGVPNHGIRDLIRSGELDGDPSQYVDGSSGDAPVVEARARALLQLYLRAADVVVTVSNFSKTELIRFLNLPPAKVAVTREAAADTFQKPITDQALAKVKQQYQLPESFVLFVGGFHRHKNVATLVRAFAELKRDYPRLGLVLVGGTRPEVAQLLGGFGLGDHDVVCVERIPEADLHALYRLAALFVTLAWHEGFCLPIVEAMSCGTPVVASRFGAIPEILDGGGLLVDPRHIDEVVDAIRGVLGSPTLRDELRRRGRRRSQAFSWKQTAEETLQIYERLLATKRSALQTVPA